MPRPPPTPDEQDPRVLVEVGHYLREDQAEDRALVVLAMGLPYWIIPTEGMYSLFVDGHDAEAVSAELAAFESERQAEREHRNRLLDEAEREPVRENVPTLSLYLFVWIMIGFFVVQLIGPADWTARGAAESQAILSGDWWRTITALTLHGDLAHLTANLLVGIIFARALLPYMGTGWTWFGILLSGIGGNALNAWGYRGGSHSSIGASTAVFGGLGMLVGIQLYAALRKHLVQRAHPFLGSKATEVIFPIGAGLALLAFLGSGGDGQQRVDYMAHLFGMLTGTVIGFVLARFHIPQRTSPPLQRLAAALAILILCLGWVLAYAR